MTSGDHTIAHLQGAPMRPERAGPLADVRVVDLTQALAGPFATMMLADMGADVIKVEPPEGDGVRVVGPYTEVDDEHHFGGYFACNNRNKRSVVLDLKDPDDVETLLEFVDTADVLVENYRAGVMDRLGLSYERLHERNPRLVYTAVRGFGDPRTGEGPYTSWPSYDIVAQSMGGVLSHTGSIGGEMVASGPNVGDIYPATVAVAGVLAALHHAKRTGEGQFVDISMFDSVISMCESMTWRYAYTGETMVPGGAQHPSLSPFELYDCADGQIAIAAPGPAQWGPLCDVIGRPDMVEHEKFRSSRRRVLHREEVREAITAWTGVRTREVVVDALGGRVPCGPVNTAADLVADPHVKAREMLVAVDHPGSERQVLTPNTPIRFLDTPTGIYRPAPKLGEHTEEVLEEVAAMRADRPH